MNGHVQVEIYKGVPIYKDSNEVYEVPFPANVITYQSLELAKISIDGWRKVMDELEKKHAK